LPCSILALWANIRVLPIFMIPYGYMLGDENPAQIM
jgi:hypothetical protein